jgi:hypothetical protein
MKVKQLEFMGDCNTLVTENMYTFHLKNNYCNLLQDPTFVGISEFYLLLDLDWNQGKNL